LVVIFLLIFLSCALCCRLSKQQLLLGLQLLLAKLEAVHQAQQHPLPYSTSIKNVEKEMANKINDLCGT
jgi:hypothetical protein